MADISPDVNKIVEEIRSGNRTILGKAITLIESSLPAHQKTAQRIIEKCLPYSGNSIRVGITGSTGVGKSLFIDALGKMLIDKGYKVTVLAIDPTSERSNGSILGDKTRMRELSASKKAFIRPSPTGGTLGGVARKTRETIILCEAAGYDVIFVETVGVGQSEIAVHSMVDCFLLLVLPGAGDELQGIKRGITEMADIIAITKADGDNINNALITKTEYANALHLFPAQNSGWKPTVEICSAYTKEGIRKIWNLTLMRQRMLLKNNLLQKKRQEQSLYWFYETINDTLKNHFYQNEKIIKKLRNIEKKVISNKISSFIAAKELINYYFSTIKQ